MEEINNFEYIKIRNSSKSVTPINKNEVIQTNGWTNENNQYDATNLPGVYLIDICNTNKKLIPKRLIYIGNFPNISSPENEFIPLDKLSLFAIYWKEFESFLCNSYLKFNLKRKIEPTFQNPDISVMGTDLYDSDVALDIKYLFSRVYRKNKDIYKIMKQLYEKSSEYMDIQIEEERDIFLMVCADLLHNKNRLFYNLKIIALDCIERDLKRWEDKPDYFEERKKKMEELKEKLKDDKDQNQSWNNDEYISYFNKD